MLAISNKSSNRNCKWNLRFMLQNLTTWTLLLYIEAIKWTLTITHQYWKCTHRLSKHPILPINYHYFLKSSNSYSSNLLLNASKLSEKEHLTSDRTSIAAANAIFIPRISPRSRAQLYSNKWFPSGFISAIIESINIGTNEPPFTST